MTRITPLERDHAALDVRPYYDLDIERYGQVLNNTGVYAHSLPVLQAMKEIVGRYMETGAVPLSQKSLLRVRVALLNGCSFCADLHSSIGMNDGVSTEKLLELNDYENSDHYSEAERLSLRYADDMTMSDRDVDDLLFDQLSNHYSEEQIVEITFTVALENMFSKFHHALLIEPQGFCPVRVPSAVPAAHAQTVQSPSRR